MRGSPGCSGGIAQLPCSGMRLAPATVHARRVPFLRGWTWRRGGARGRLGLELHGSAPDRTCPDLVRRPPNVLAFLDLGRVAPTSVVRVGPVEPVGGPCARGPRTQLRIDPKSKSSLSILGKIKAKKGKKPGSLGDCLDLRCFGSAS